MSDIDFEALAAEELPADEDVTKTTDEGQTPEPAETNETGDETESEDAGADAGDKDKADEPDQQDEDEPKRRRPSGSERSRRQIEALRAEVEALRAAQQAPSRASGGKDLAARIVDEIGEAPKESDFAGDFLAFERAAIAYEADKRSVTRELKRADQAADARSEQAKANAKTAADQHLMGLIEEHQDRLRDLEATVPGSVAKIDGALRNGKLAPSDVLLPILLDSEKSGLLALYLAERPDKIAELNRLSSDRAHREIGRLEARLSLPKPKTATTAPPPVRPVKGAAAPASPDRDLDAWLSQQYGG